MKKVAGYHLKESRKSESCFYVSSRNLLHLEPAKWMDARR